jgi:ribosomal protein S18 acetylase RimI-like enzyme
MNQPTPIVRSAEPRDLIELARIDFSTFSEKGYSYAALRQLLEVSGSLCLLARMEGSENSAGYLLGCLESDDRRTAWMLTLAVGELHRNQGVGGCLVRTFIGMLERRGIERCCLTVSPDNDHAIALYRSHGWKETFLMKDYFGPGEDRLRMVLSIDANRFGQ